MCDCTLIEALMLIWWANEGNLRFHVWPALPSPVWDELKRLFCVGWLSDWYLRSPKSRRRRDIERAMREVSHA